MAVVFQIACATRADMFIRNHLSDVCSCCDSQIIRVVLCSVEGKLAGVDGVCSACQHLPFNSVTFTLECSASNDDKFRNVHIWHTETCVVT